MTEEGHWRGTRWRGIRAKAEAPVVATRMRTCERHQEAVTMKLPTRAALVLFVGTMSTVYAQHAEKDERTKGQHEKKSKSEASEDMNDGSAPRSD